MPVIKNRSKLADTDLCVMCGMCLPHCPTYQLYQTETESPRGRIALMQSIDQARIEADSTALQHIDHCLGCLNCETICPSRVPYGTLIDEFRQQYSEQIEKSFFSREILKATRETGGLEKLARLAGNSVIKPLLGLASKFPGIPALPQTSITPLQSFYPANSAQPSRGSVTLFSGCNGRQLDGQTLLDASSLLNQLGFDVRIPEKQSCCGALHQHNGEQQTADELLQQQRKLLDEGSDSQAFLFSSPACGASLKQLDQARFHDIRGFIIEQLKTADMRFDALLKPVALHESCSGRNLLKNQGLNRQLLAFIPSLEIITSSQPALCCGAGGLQSFNHPVQAQALADQKLSSFDLAGTNILLSDNIGCSLHIKNTLKGYNHHIEVLHPLSLLKRQLRIT